MSAALLLPGGSATCGWFVTDESNRALHLNKSRGVCDRGDDGTCGLSGVFELHCLCWGLEGNVQDIIGGVGGGCGWLRLMSTLIDVV